MRAVGLLQLMLVVLGTANRAVNISIGRNLTEFGYSVIGAASREETIRATFESHPDAVVIDVRMDDDAGVELIRMIRAATDVPILALGPNAGPEETVAALEAGADDVMPYTIDRIELGARLRAALRRRERMAAQNLEPASVVTTGALVIDRPARTVTKAGRPIRLTRAEFRLLDALASRVGQVAPRRFLLSAVWGAASISNVHSLRLYINYLRKKLEDHPSEPEYILTEWGVGYRLAARPPAPTTAAEEPPESEEEEGGHHADSAGG